MSDDSGVSNVYRLDRETLDVTRVTDEQIGVSGITALSPAISIGSGGKRIAMSVYSRGAFEIRALDVPRASSAPVRTAVARTSPRSQAAAAIVPPIFQSRRYRPSLSLVSFGQPYLSAGGGAFGSFFRAGVAFRVGDLFGEQSLDTAVQVGTKASDFAVESSFSASTFRRIGETTTLSPSSRSATSAVTGAALVHDTTVFGATGPTMGQRYRASIGAMVSDLTVTTASGDYHRYFAPLDRLTIATRVQQVSRLGRDAGDPRLLPLVWSPRDIVRGYTRDAVAERASQVAIVNLEARTPLAALIGRPASERLLPVGLFAFSDWGRFAAPQTLALAAASRQLWSAGFGARVNAAGFVFEFNGARTLMPATGWHFVVNFRPGF